MSYRPYPSSKKSISYSSRHHLIQAYKPPVVRGYGSRSPFQTGSGSGNVSASAPLSFNSGSIGLNIAEGLTTVTASGLTSLVTHSARSYGSFDLVVPGSIIGAQVLSCVDKNLIGNRLNLSATSNVIDTVNTGVYEVNGWISHQYNLTTLNQVTGLEVVDSSSNSVLLDCKYLLTSNYSANGTSMSNLYGFFQATGPVCIRLFNSRVSGTSFVKDGDLSIKRIA